MKYVIWIFRIVLFLILLGFALKNTDPVVVRYFFGYEWQASLVLVLLTFFAAGVAVGMLALIGNLLRQRKEIVALKSRLKLHDQLDAELKKEQSAGLN